MRRRRDGGTARGCAGQKSDHQIGGLAANTPAYEETKAAGNAPAKSNNAKSVAARRGMRRQTKQHQIGGLAANAPAKEATPNWWIGGECTGKRRDSGTTVGCAGRTKRMRRGDEMHRPNEKRKARRWMHSRTRNGGAVMECTGRTKKRRRADGMRRPNKETAAH